MKRENIAILGVTPNKPSDLRHYMALITAQFKEFQEPVVVGGQRVRAVLICVANDILAARKMVGFKGVNAEAGCNRCEKRFLRLGLAGEGSSHASYTDHSNAELRTNAGVRRQMAEYLACEDTKEAERKAKSTGVFYTPLINLPYFDPVRMTIVDPMHNLFLGIQKTLIECWRELPLRSARLRHPNNVYAARGPFAYVAPDFPVVRPPRFGNACISPHRSRDAAVAAEYVRRKTVCHSRLRYVSVER